MDLHRIYDILLDEWNASHCDNDSLLIAALDEQSGNQLSIVQGDPSIIEMFLFNIITTRLDSNNQKSLLHKLNSVIGCKDVVSKT